MNISKLETTTFLTPTTCFTVACIALALSTVWRNARSENQKTALAAPSPEAVARPQQQRRKAVDDLFAETREENNSKPRQNTSAQNQHSQIGELVSLCASIAQLLRKEDHDTRTASVVIDLMNDLSMLIAALCRAQQRMCENPTISSNASRDVPRLQAIFGALEATLVLLEASIDSRRYSNDAISNAAHNIREQTTMLDSFSHGAARAREPPTPPPEVIVEACLDGNKVDNAYLMPCPTFDTHTGITPGVDDKCWIEPPPEYSPPAEDRSNIQSEKSNDKVEIQTPFAESPQREDKLVDSSALYDAVNANDSTALDDLLKRGVDPSTKFGNLKRTALHQAAHLNHCSCITTLIKHAAVMSTEDAKGDTALHLAAWAGNVEALTALVSHAEEVDWLSGRDGYSPLWCAISARQIDAARLLLKHGARVSLRAASGGGLTPVHQAAVTGQSAMVELLLERGAQVDCVDDDLNTPLHYAAASGSVSSVNILLRHGANLEAVQSHCLTAVHWASHTGRVAALRVLLDNGARLDRRAEEGATPLHLAANRNHVDVVRLLLERGARKDVGNAAWDGVSGTPAAMAKAKGHEQLAKLLMV